jgi:hypothetical protein
MYYSEFPTTVSERLGHYVYILKDPRDGKIFYIGRGKGNRVFDHVRCDLDGVEVFDKLDIIREIHSYNLDVDYSILRHGLTEKMSYEVEEAAIDLMGLDSLKSGVVSHRGIKGIDDIISLYDFNSIEKDEPFLIVTKEQVRDLVIKKNINNPHFVDFLSYFFGHYDNSDARVDLFNILNDDNNLISLTEKLNINSRSSLISEIENHCELLSNNICLSEFIRYIYGYRAKGIGKGEYLFPFLFKNWKYSSDGDAMVEDQSSIYKGEVKNSDGASLKPILASDAPNRGIIDILNKSIFDNNVPFSNGWSIFCSKVSNNDLLEKFKEYFRNLFPVWDSVVIEDLSLFLVENYTDVDKCDDYYSRIVFKQYKMYENQSFLIMLDDNLNLVIISDPMDSNLQSLGVGFQTKMRRGSDTQAVPDGYVNIRLMDITKSVKRRRRK